MVYFTTSQEWLERSTLLLEARPATTRITTKYSIKPIAQRPSATTPAEPAKPRGVLVLKTYDPVSGVTLKYRTHKAAEVSRLIYASLGRLGRNMAAVPVKSEEEEMADAPVVREEEKEVKVPVAGQQGGGGGKKKKKGKK